jgi:hypothetical protein
MLQIKNLKASTEEQEILKEIDIIKERIDKYKASGVGQLKQMEAKLKKIGSPSTYTVYQDLCDHTHNNPIKLIERHLTIQGQAKELKVLQTINPKALIFILSTLANILFNAVYLFCETCSQELNMNLENIASLNTKLQNHLTHHDF